MLGLAALADHLKLENFALAAHDIGGGAAQIFTIDHPDRVNRLILSNCIAYDTWPVEEMLRFGDPAAMKNKPADELRNFIRAVYKAGRLSATRDEVDAVTAPWADEEGLRSLVRNAAALNTNHTMAIVDRLSTIKCPTLLLLGRRRQVLAGQYRGTLGGRSAECPDQTSCREPLGHARCAGGIRRCRR